MRVICRQTIFMKYHTLFFRKLGKMSQNVSSAAVVIGALKVKVQQPVISLDCKNKGHLILHNKTWTKQKLL